MKRLLDIIANLHLTPRLYLAIGALASLQLLSYFYPSLRFAAGLAALALLLVVMLDGIMLFWPEMGLFARRETPPRFSNGDNNTVSLFLENRYPFTVGVTIIDELPFQFQLRDAHHRLNLASGESGQVSYVLRPTERGEYHFGILNTFVTSPPGLLMRRYRCDRPVMVPVYPSFIQMRRYELMAISNRLPDAGVKRIRRVGHTLEFDQIRAYVPGDDYRTVNWKATARRRELMVNHFQDERSQQIYCVIDMGRVMKMPFEGLSLLDYAINASLVIANIALLKHDRAGVITFSNQVNAVLPADRSPAQMQRIMETLYRQTTGFLESDHERLFITLMRTVAQRSLILLFSNFETLTALRRQLPYLRRVAAKHLLVVIFFENTELGELLMKPSGSLETVYRKTIAEQFAFEKRQIVLELQRYGIYTVLTEPRNLTVNTINQYLVLKSRGAI